jgi:hypothetical protein
MSCLSYFARFIDDESGGGVWQADYRKTQTRDIRLAAAPNGWSRKTGCCGLNTSRLSERSAINLFPLRFTSNSKLSNSENRTEWMESRASERIGPFGE